LSIVQNKTQNIDESKLQLSVIIPIYNEAGIIPNTIANVNDVFSRKSGQNGFEIIVVNDGSTDNTNLVLDKETKKYTTLKVISYVKNKGKGWAVREGLRSAQGELVLFCDCDLSTPLDYFFDMLPLFEKGNQIVIASRNIPNSSRIVKQSFIRQILGKLFPFLVWLLCDIKQSDTQCGFKGFTKMAAKELALKQTIFKWAFDVEYLVIAQSLRLSVAEIPVVWTAAKSSKIKLIRDGTRKYLLTKSKESIHRSLSFSQKLLRVIVVVKCYSFVNNKTNNCRKSSGNHARQYYGSGDNSQKN
jgi:dolichyl-phosphate beta-glucosyltransferase